MLDVSDESQRQEVLGLGTMICIILLVGYGAFENGPVHRSRLTEKVYLGLVFTIFLVTILVASGSLSCYFGQVEDRDQYCETWEGASLGIWKTMILGIIFLAVLTEILPGPPSKYTGRVAQDSIARATAQAKQIVIQLKKLVKAYRKAESKAVPARKQFWPIGVILVLIETFTTSWTALAMVFRVIVLLMVLVVLAHLCMKAYRFCFVKPEVRRRIYEELRYAVEVLKAEELEHVILEVNMAQLVESASHQTLSLLFKDAREKLTTTSMVVLLDALMKRSPATMRWDGFDQRLAEELICGVQGLQLTRLKNLVDTTGNIHSLHRLIFYELHSVHRDRILKHFKTQGDKVRLGWKQVPLKILSDVDDTLWCGGKFPAGCDTRYPRHAIYPGVLSFFAALDNWHEEEVMDLKLSVMDQAALYSSQRSLGHLSPSGPSRQPGTSLHFGMQQSDVRNSQASHFDHEGNCISIPGEKENTPQATLGSVIEGSESNDAMRTSIDSRMSFQSEEDQNIHLHSSNTVEVEDNHKADVEQVFVKTPPKRRVNILRALNACTLPQLTKRLVLSGARELIVRLEPQHVNLIFLSARPHVFQDVAEEKSFRRFRKLAQEGRMHCEPQLLSGRLSVSLGAVLRYGCMKTKSWQQVGELKARAFEEHVQLYPEYDYVFCGDNGQGDLLAAERMLQSPFQDKVKAAFINDVKPHNEHLSLHPQNTYDSKMDLQDGPRIFFSKTYIGSAAMAFQKELLSKEELNSVMRHAVADLQELHALHPRWDFNDVVFQMNADLNCANELVQEPDLQVKPVQLSQSRPELNTPMNMMLSTVSSVGRHSVNLLRRTSSELLDMSSFTRRRHSTGSATMSSCNTQV
eukprot:gnl/MRDRNA2_/MRDRNA2_153932_c0_seq1.p1 gnl/MRDRNA2_/MRDRNA2_153932_c0~~gnl/MRDRNA2_/MRDRNA2_153932_c0_seq1.p1  ORF type:complete len:861 (+),score=137.01 gnl/MRDRNA2_/MRDRNA2_153932_c0_seq1:96-2678(+)